MTKAGRVRIDYRLDATGVATLRHALVSMARMARAAGALDIMAAGTTPAWFRSSAGGGDAAFERYLDDLAAFDFRPNRGTVLSAHQMGTARMGAVPRDHVCDPGGRVRAGDRDDTVIGGLYVGGHVALPDRPRGQPDADRDGAGSAGDPDGPGGGRDRVPRARGLHPAARRDDEGHREHDDRARDDGPRLDRLLQDDRPQDHRHDRD